MRRRFDGKTLVCVYDCAVQPVSYNFVEVVSTFEYVAKSEGKSFFLVILDAGLLSKGVKSRSRISNLNLESHDHRIRNMIAPLAFLFPSCSGFSILSNRSDFERLYGSYEIHPKGYSPLSPDSNTVLLKDYKFVGQGLRVLRSTPHSVKLVQTLVEPLGKEIITVTLRRTEFDPPRNSKLPEWSKFVEYCKTLGFRVVVVPDADNPSSFSPIKKEDIYFEFAYNIDLRLALYQQSRINFFVSNGPTLLSSMSDSDAITVLMNSFSPGSVVDTVEGYAMAGCRPGEPNFWYNDGSRNCLLDDTFENMVQVLSSVLNRSAS